MSEESLKKKEILVAEDDEASAGLLKKILEKADYSVQLASNGKKAYALLTEKKYDILLTDWMMPQMDGIELIRKVRETISVPPGIIVLTALTSHEARKHALNSGADDFLTKPYMPVDIVDKIRDLLSRIHQKPSSLDSIPVIKPDTNPPFTGICIAASSGGPQTLIKIISKIPLLGNSALFIVQHGPQWALKDMADFWNKFCCMEVKLGSDGEKIEPATVYLAPGKFHMTVDPGSLHIKLEDGPPENFIKPSADPLFRSVAKCFGQLSLAVVLSGMGCDGTLGSQYIEAVNGVVIAQDPDTALVRFMPDAVIKSVRSVKIIPIDDIPDAIVRHASEQSKFITK